MTPEKYIPELDKYSLVVLKPDSLRDCLTDNIIADLEEHGLFVIYRKTIQFNREIATYVYEEHKNSENFPFMVESLLLKKDQGEQYPCILLLLRAESVALEKTRIAKGRADKSGIRAKYRKYYWYELEEMGHKGDELKHLLSRNRLHVPDDHNMMLKTVGILLNEKDINQLRLSDKKLADFLSKYLKEVGSY